MSLFDPLGFILVVLPVSGGSVCTVWAHRVMVRWELYLIVLSIRLWDLFYDSDCDLSNLEGDYLGGEAYWAGGLHLYTPLPFRPGRGGFGDLFRTHFFLNAGNLCNLNYGENQGKERKPIPSHSSLKSHMFEMNSIFTYLFVYFFPLVTLIFRLKFVKWK